MSTESSPTTSAPPSPRPRAQRDLFIGRLQDTTNPDFFNGTIDEVRIYSRALSDEEVASTTWG